MREVEEVLEMHSAVKESVCFGVPHARLGESSAAAVVLKNGATTTEQGVRVFRP